MSTYLEIYMFISLGLVPLFSAFDSSFRMCERAVFKRNIFSGGDISGSSKSAYFISGNEPDIDRE